MSKWASSTGCRKAHLFRKAVGHQLSPRAKSSLKRRKARRFALVLGRRILSSVAVIRLHGRSSIRAFSALRRRHGDLHVPRTRTWHPNPASTTNLAADRCWTWAPNTSPTSSNLFGPVAKVAGFAFSPRSERLITSEPRNGEKIPVHVATHVAGALAFQNGAVVQVGMSFDVAGHKHVPLELYGTEGTLLVPDPNHFGGEVQLLKKGGEFETQTCRRPMQTELPIDWRCQTWPHAIRSKSPTQS